MSANDKFSSLNHFKEHKTNSQSFNAVAMDKSGKFQFDNKQELFQKLAKLKQDGIKKISLVQFNATDKTKAFFDIDRLESEDSNLQINFEQALSIIKETIEENYDGEDHGLIITKNKKYSKYHVYFTNIIINKFDLRRISETINEKAGFELIDTCLLKRQNGFGSLLRFEGFHKFQTKEPFVDKYEPETDYYALDDVVMNEEFYEKTCLLVDSSAEITPIINSRSQETSPLASQQTNENDAEERKEEISFLDESDEQDEEEKDSQENTQTFPETIEEKLETNYQDLWAIVSNYPIRSGGITETDDCFIFDCDKSTHGRTCPFKRVIHNSNNCFLVYLKSEKKLFLKCRDQQCQNASKLVWKHQDLRDLQLEENEDYFISTGDSNLARLFQQVYGEQWKCAVFKGKRMFIEFDGKCYRVDKYETRLRLLLADEFTEYLTNLIDQAQREGKISNESTYKKARRHMSVVLEPVTKQNNVIRALKDRLFFEGKFDQGPNWFVMGNGCYDFFEPVEENAFGCSKPQDRVTNFLHAPFDFKKREECEEEIAELIARFEQIQPDPEKRFLYLQYLSTGLFGSFHRYFMINTSEWGGSGKTFGASLTLAVTGKGDNNYGTTISSQMFQSREPDRASLAQLDSKRFGLIDEVDVRYPLNGALIKLLSGCPYFNQRGFNSSNTQNKNNLSLLFTMNKFCQIQPEDDGIDDRILLLKFNSKFTKEPAKVDPAKRIYLRDASLMDEEYLTKMQCAMFHLLVQHLKPLLIGGRVFKPPSVMNQEKKDFIEGTNDFIDYLNETIVAVQDETKIILIQDLKKVFETSQYFADLPSKTRRSSRKYLIDQIKTIAKYKNAYEPDRKPVKGIRFQNFLKGFEFKDAYYKEKYDVSKKTIAVKRRKNEINSDEPASKKMRL